MPLAPPSVPFTTISVDRSSPVPLHRQLCDSFREAILAGKLAPGVRLPSTRIMAHELGVSRNTMLNVFEQLEAEGYVKGHVGAGTHVAQTIPDDLLYTRGRALSPFRVTSVDHMLSRRGRVLSSTGAFATRIPHKGPFRTGLAAVDEFPTDIWSRLLTRRLRVAPADLLGYSDPAGYRPLREAVAAYIGGSRAVRCDPDQVIIMGGAQQALDVLARVLLNPGDPVWIEDPGYMGARAAFAGNGARLIPLPVDDEGLDVAAGVARCPEARLAYVTPSHQFPLCVTMSLSRRLPLLEWASRANAWVIEDDHDSEFRYTGRPLGSLQGLDTQGVVIYVGTFSKIVFPALRLGYAVVPHDLIDAVSSARAVAGLSSPLFDQAVLADFITEGHLARHVRRMRTLYAERQEVLIEAVESEIGDLLEVHETEGGMQVTGWLPEGVDDRQASILADQHGIHTLALSDCSIEYAGRGGLRLGYTHLTPEAIRDGVKRLGAALSELAISR